ncbi:N-acetylmuramoyl-L-alanine amidase family protein [Pelosinus propionicus]|uniref:N-acetylmuramoyl-L-alanine amidase n=1 Tax=Pelosinus propionicus DSM 13327 TaxID=1123291 RepID=A0A1I4GTJ9_9FIRM|nr:N-acetylmuramoyl-L-alanine amidase [Pelosinus propionicus]SFL33338.1 N-acetylmuramoyl-L-alanine amidase [Pelosinus propionicus DSM 13327]
MRIVIDGQKVPVNVRVSRDLLMTLKAMSQTLHWRITYDTANELVYIYSPNYVMPGSLDRPAPVIEEPASQRLLGKIICLDAGHGGNDPGAIGPSGTMEKDNTLAITLLLRDMLENNGATVVLTRDSDRNVSLPDASAGEELAARVEIAKDSNADIFISIHNDSFTGNTAVGTTTFHYGDPQSIKLAALVQKNLVTELGTKDHSSRFASFYVIRYTKMTAILIQAAFISNPEEEVLLSSIDGRTKIAESIFQGIVNYYKV